jgi:hypothetical protein
MWYTQHPAQSPHSLQLTRRAQLAQQDYLASIAQHCSHALTLQTSLATQGVSEALMLKNFETARQSLHQLRVRSNRALTGNGWQRNPRYLPIFVPVIEGTVNTYDRNRTLHIHLAVGNLPERYTESDLLGIYRGCWLSTPCAADDVVLIPLRINEKAGWGHYLTKEERQGRTDSVDYHNTQIPQHILATLQAA